MFFRRKFLEQCWVFVPEDRPSISQLLDQLNEQDSLLVPCLDTPVSAIVINGRNSIEMTLPLSTNKNNCHSPTRTANQLNSPSQKNGDAGAQPCPHGSPLDPYLPEHLQGRDNSQPFSGALSVSPSSSSSLTSDSKNDIHVIVHSPKWTGTVDVAKRFTGGPLDKLDLMESRQSSVSQSSAISGSVASLHLVKFEDKQDSDYGSDNSSKANWNDQMASAV